MQPLLKSVDQLKVLLLSENENRDQRVIVFYFFLTKAIAQS